MSHIVQKENYFLQPLNGKIYPYFVTLKTKILRISLFIPYIGSSISRSYISLDGLFHSIPSYSLTILYISLMPSLILLSFIVVKLKRRILSAYSSSKVILFSLSWNFYIFLMSLSRIGLQACTWYFRCGLTKST